MRSWRASTQKTRTPSTRQRDQNQRYCNSYATHALLLHSTAYTERNGVAQLVERGAGTGRRKGSERRLANADQHQRESSRPLQTPNVVATTQGTWKETSEVGCSSRSSVTKKQWWANRFSSVGNPWRLFWRDQLGDPACPYITRWVVDIGPLGSLRLHHWYGNDDQRAMHDHPWGFLTLVLWGGYADVHYAEPPTEHGSYHTVTEWLRAGQIRWRSATHAHTVQTTGAWTLLWTQPKQRYFGFFVRLGSRVKWFKANKFFATFGNPPCE